MRYGSIFTQATYTTSAAVKNVLYMLMRKMRNASSKKLTVFIHSILLPCCLNRLPYLLSFLKIRYYLKDFVTKTLFKCLKFFFTTLLIKKTYERQIRGQWSSLHIVFFMLDILLGNLLKND